MTAANAALKELITDTAVETLVYKKNPLLALMGKFTEFGGKYMPIPIVTSVSQGRSATFASAQAKQTQDDYGRMVKDAHDQIQSNWNGTADWLRHQERK